MLKTVSDRSGFVWKYSLDLKERYGEVKVRKTMIWVEPPGNHTVGEMLLEAWLATGDTIYRLYAQSIGETLIRGQLFCGGWVVQIEILDENDYLRIPPIIILGYDTVTFVTRMYRLFKYLYSLQYQNRTD